MRHQTSCFRPSTSCLSDHLPRGGGSERESRGRGLETCREISGLPGPRSAKFGFGMDVCFITPIKNLPSRWERMRKLEGGGQGWGGVQEPERGREAVSQCGVHFNYNCGLRKANNVSSKTLLQLASEDFDFDLGLGDIKLVGVGVDFPYVSVTHIKIDNLHILRF